MAAIFLLLSLLLFIFSVYFLISLKKPGVYPPKYVLKKRSGTMLIGSLLFLFLAIMVKILFY